MKINSNITILLFSLFLQNFCSCGTVTSKQRNGDIITETSIPYIKKIKNSKDSNISKTNKISATGQPTLSELQRSGDLLHDPILLFNKYVIVEKVIHVEPIHRNHYIRDYEAYIYNYETGTQLGKNDWKVLRPLIISLIDETKHPESYIKKMGIIELSNVISITAFRHFDVVFYDSNEFPIITSPKLRQFAKDSYIFEFYVREPWTLFGQPYTYCKLTITPDKIEFESHDVELNGKTTDADGNIIEENE